MHGGYKVLEGELVVIDLEVNQDAFVDVTLSGDFFLDPDNTLTRVAQALEGVYISASAKEIAKLIEASLESGDVLMGIAPAAVGVAVKHALGHALNWEDIDSEVVHGPIVNPVVNVALDETLVEDVAAGRCKPFMRLWEWNGLQVVIGSLQSYQNEIQPEGVERHGILVSYRVTGSGAMFMEPGNCVAYSLVVPTALVEETSFEQSYPFFNQWVMEVLEKVGIKAKCVPLNDIVSEIGKIGGATREHWSNGYVVHHVTMACDIDAEGVNEALHAGMGETRDKGTRNAVERVNPMRSQTDPPRETILRTFYNHFTQKYRATPSEITEADLTKAEECCVTKSAIEEWTHRIP